MPFYFFSYYGEFEKKPRYTLLVLARCAPRQKLTIPIALAAIRQLSG